jgi:hypothetical protein
MEKEFSPFPDVFDQEKEEKPTESGAAQPITPIKTPPKDQESEEIQDEPFEEWKDWD